MNLKRLFGIWLASVVTLLILFSLFGPKGKKINWREIDFHSSQSASLYFKNLRAYYYDWESIDSTSLEMYRIQSRKNYSKDSIQAVLVRNWKADEVYLLFEKTDHQAWNENLNLKWNYGDSSGIISLEESQVDAHYRFAAQLYYQLDREAELFLTNKQTPMEKKACKSLKTSLKDYFKWVGKLR